MSVNTKSISRVWRWKHSTVTEVIDDILWDRFDTETPRYVHFVDRDEGWWNWTDVLDKLEPVEAIKKRPTRQDESRRHTD